MEPNTKKPAVERLPLDRRAAVLAYLEKRVWTGVPKEEKGRVMTRAEEDASLGYGPTGV